ncbi:unnamed protein product [Lactuca virosa]|uniref:Uncharacterized protein n=1 Tax=Lactuca virosa TaxID=75947 RepID=A0AAU9LWR1_9ASTR|nr:unnamed protein product [Lactuca virosa]
MALSQFCPHLVSFRISWGCSRSKTDNWIVMYGLFYGINVDYTSILWEDFLTFLPTSKNKFLIPYPYWWSIIIHDVINNSNLTPEKIPEGPLPLYLRISPYRIRIASESEFSQPVIIPDAILAKPDENNEPTSPPKSGTSSKALSFLDSLFQPPFCYVEPSSPALVSPAGFQSVLECPSNFVSLDYDSLEDDDQDSEKHIQLEDLSKSSPVQDNQDEDTPMQMVDIPSSEGLIVDDEPHDMSINLYSTPSTRTFNIDLDNYSPSPQKESQEHDYTHEAKFSSFPPDPHQDDGTPVDTNEANTSEPDPKRIRINAQMVADGIEEIRFHTSSRSKYLAKFQWYLERMADNVCILNETTKAQVKKLMLAIEDFDGTAAYIRGQVIRNMQRIETLDQKIHNTIEDCLSPMHQKIDDFIQSLSSLESVYESKLDHLLNHVTAQDRYISTLENSIAEISEASISSSTSPFQTFSEQKDNNSSREISSPQKAIQLLVNEFKAIKTQSSYSVIHELQQKVALTDSKLDLILAKLSGSNDRPPGREGEKFNMSRSSQSPIIHQILDSPNEFEKRRQEKLESLDKMAADARLKAQQNRAKMAETEKELIRKQGIKNPTLKVPRRKDIYITKPVTISEPFAQQKLPQIDPKDRGKQKYVFRDSYQKVKLIKPTNFFTPPSGLTKEKWDIPAPPNGMKFNLWPSEIYLVEPDVDIEELGQKEAEEPDLDLNMENESPGNILKNPHRGVVFSSKGRLRFMRISQKHRFSSEFIQGIIGLLKRT